MKKIAVLLAVLSLLAGAALAAPAAVKSTAKTDAQTAADSKNISTVIKEMSQAQFPGVFVPGSLIGTSVFISDLPLLANTALFEYVNGSTFAVGVLKTDLGVFGLSLSPVPYNYLEDIGVGTPNNVVGLQYARKIGSMPLGASILYGYDNSWTKNGSVSTNNLFGDVTNDNYQYLALRAGVDLSGIALSLGVSFANYWDYFEELDFPTGAWNYTEKNSNSKMLIDIAARMGLGNGFTGVLALTWLSGSLVYDYDEDIIGPGSKYSETYSNNKLGISALLANTIKAGTWLVVRVASGVKLAGDATARYVYQDHFIDGFTTYSTNPAHSDLEFTVPLNVAIEGKLDNTWSINGGVRTVLLNIYGNTDKFNAATSGTAEKWTDYESDGSFDIDPGIAYALGLSGRIGDLSLDMWLDPSILIYGPEFISGNNGTNLNYGVAVRFDWQ